MANFHEINISNEMIPDTGSFHTLANYNNININEAAGHEYLNSKVKQESITICKYFKDIFNAVRNVKCKWFILYNIRFPGISPNWSSLSKHGKTDVLYAIHFENEILAKGTRTLQLLQRKPNKIN